MVNRVDSHVGEIVGALEAAGLWSNTLLTLWADNGGPIYGGAFTCELCDGDAGANNFPLRGGKHSNFEGGVRVNALVAGGLLPAAARGRTLTGLVAVEDIFSTFATLAGLDPFDARGAAGFTPAQRSAGAEDAALADYAAVLRPPHPLHTYLWTVAAPSVILPH